MPNWLSLIANITLKLIGPILAYLKGRGDAEYKQAKENLEAMRDAKKIHEKIDKDAEYRKKIRDKYR